MSPLTLGFRRQRIVVRASAGAGMRGRVPLWLSLSERPRCARHLCRLRQLIQRRELEQADSAINEGTNTVAPLLTLLVLVPDYGLPPGETTNRRQPLSGRLMTPWGRPPRAAPVVSSLSQRQ
jgi:hypothetical protein